MLSKGSGFAHYSKGLCWVVSLIWLALSVQSFTGNADNSTIIGFLWLAGAVTFAASALFLGRGTESDDGADTDGHQV